MTTKEGQPSADTLGLTPLKLRDKDGREVRNAENLVATEDGRIFVSGSDDVFEIVADGKGGLRLEPIFVTADGVPPKCSRNGLAVSGQWLYVACSYFKSKEWPLSPMVCEWANTAEQTLTNITFAYMLPHSRICDAESWILRADLTAPSPAFAEVVAKFGPQFFANGLAVDAAGEHLFVANSLEGASSGIYRISTPEVVSENVERPWFAPACGANGIKLRDQTLYYTGNRTAPVLRAGLGRVNISAEGKPTGDQLLYRAPFCSFDDFDVAAGGFVVAAFANFASPWTGWAGNLRFMSRDGKDMSSIPGVRRPSAVLIVRNDKLFKKGDVLITDKDTHGVFCLRPDEDVRQWLLGETALAVAA